KGTRIAEFRVTWEAFRVPIRTILCFLIIFAEPTFAGDPTTFIWTVRHSSQPWPSYLMGTAHIPFQKDAEFFQRIANLMKGTTLMPEVIETEDKSAVSIMKLFNLPWNGLRKTLGDDVRFGKLEKLYKKVRIGDSRFIPLTALNPAVALMMLI